MKICTSTLGLGTLLGMMVWLAPSPALSLPMANVSYGVSNLGGDQWRYDITVSNASSGPDSGYTLYDILFEPGVDFLYTTAPLGWDDTFQFSGGDDSFVDFSSIDMDEDDLYENDIQAGSSLGGFSLIFAAQSLPTDIRFEAMFWKTTDLDNPITINGVVKSAADPVPEPATMLLMGTGLVGLIGVRRKK